MIQNSKVSLIEDVELAKTLATSKEISENTTQILDQARTTMKKIDEAWEMFRIVGRQASVLYFVLADLNKIDPMYQFSLDWYKLLFRKSIDDSKENMEADRNKSILNHHTSAVFNISARSLFEKHKLLLSLQMCVKLLISRGELNLEDWNFFLWGGTVLDRTT